MANRIIESIRSRECICSSYLQKSLDKCFPAYFRGKNKSSSRTNVSILVFAFYLLAGTDINIIVTLIVIWISVTATK